MNNLNVMHIICTLCVYSTSKRTLKLQVHLPFLDPSGIRVKGYGGGGVIELSALCVNIQSCVLVREICRELGLHLM